MRRIGRSAWVVVAVVLAVTLSCGGGSGGGRPDTGNEEAFDWGGELDAPEDDLEGDLQKPDVTPDLPPDIAPDTPPDVTPDTPPDVTPDTTPDVPGDAPTDTASTLPLAGELVVTEIMAKSQAGTDDGEWIEITNVTAKSFELAGCVLADDTSEAHTIAGSLVAGPGAVLVLAKSADPALNHGLSPDYVYTGIALSNGGDEVILRCPADGGDVLVDRVAYTSAQVATGVALQLDPASTDATANDDADAWCPATLSYATGVFGTPGETNPPCGGGGSVGWCRFQHPLDLTTGAGTTFAAYGHVFVAGVTDATAGVDVNPLLLGQAGYGPDGSDPATGGWTWVPAAANAGWNDAAAGEPGNDEYVATVSAPAPGTYDTAYRFSYDGGATWTYCDGPAGAGHDGSEDGYQPADAGTLVTEPSPCDPNPCTAVPQATCGADGLTLTTYAAPGTCAVVNGQAACDYPPTVVDCADQGGVCENGACTGGPSFPAPSVPGDVLVTEFMAKSQANTDPGEWLELYNASDVTLDLGGCILHDSGTTDVHAIMGPLVVPAGGYLVLAKSGVAAENHGVEPDYVYAKFNLGNSGDAIILTCGDADIDAVVYTSGWVVQGTSLQLDPVAYDAAANDLFENWCASKTTFGPDGLFGTPGTANAGCQSPKVGWCRFQHPMSITVGLNEAVATYGRVYAEGTTDLTTGTDASAALLGEVGVGPDGSQPSGNAAWAWTAAAANPAWVDTAEPGNDEYQATVSVTAAGTYDLAYRFSLDGGATWVYCDGAAGVGHDGSEDGYDPANAGNLVAKAAACDPNPCVNPPAASCQDGTTVLSHPAPGTCTVVDGFAECTYDDATTDCAAEGKVCLGGQCVVEGTGVPPAAAGDVLITELMPRSQAGSGDTGEWVELYNATAGLLDLNGCVLKDDDTDAFTIPSSLLVPPGQYVVLAASLDPAKNHGVPADLAWTTFTLTNNSDDEVVLQCGGVVIDRVAYTPAWVLLGTALQLSSGKYDATANDAFENWCAATTGYGTDVPQLLGTPDQPNHTCAKTRVDWCRLQHPLDLTLDAGATATYYARVYVGGLTDLTPGVDPADVLKAEIGFGPDGAAPDGATGWTWFAATGNPGWDGAAAGEPANDEYQAALGAPVPGTYDTAARFSYDGGTTWTYCDRNAGVGADGSEDGYGAANAGSLLANATPCAPNPCTAAPAAACDGTSIVTYEATGTCTVVDAAASCAYAESRTDCAAQGKVCVQAACVLEGQGQHPAAGQVLVTEFMARSASGVDEGEWIELTNVGTAKVDLGGCVLKDAGTETHTVAGVLIATPGDPLVLARSGDPAKNWGLAPDYVYANFTLGNSGDTIELVCDGATIDKVVYATAWISLGASTQLKPEAFTATDNDLPESWCFGRPAYGTALPPKLGTPGAPNHTCAPVQVGWCRFQHPMGSTVDVEVPVTTYGRVYIPWITERTNGVDEDESIVAQVGWGPDGSAPDGNADWKWLAAVPNPAWDAVAAGEPKNDEYQADVSLAVPGQYDLAYRFSADAGATWVYCDGAAGFGADGSEDGYQPANAAGLQVNATTCKPNPCTSAPAPACVGQTLTTYSGPGTCTDNAGTADCAYPSAATDCAAEGKICDATGFKACIVPGQGNTPKAAGALLITEFMAKSQAGDDPGEWFEVTNTTSEILDLGGCVLRDDDQNLHSIAGVLTVQPGGRLVLVRSGDPALNHGLDYDYVYANFTLGNSSDVIQIDCGGTVIDRVAYTSTWIAEGAAAQLSLNAFDAAGNDAKEAWCTAWKPYGANGKLGTPGTLNPPCDPCTPNPCDDPPAAACDGAGTRALAYPATGTCSVVDHAAACAYPPAVTDCDAQLLVCQAGACVPSGDPCVPNPCRVAPAPTCDGNALLTYSAPGTCATVAEAAQCTFPSTSTDCAATPGYACAGGACVQSGLGNTPTTPGQVIVTEFMARSTSGTDTGEWIEVLNTTTDSLDLGGCTLHDDGSDTHTFAAPLIIGAGKRLLLAKNGDPALNHGLSPHYVYGSFDLVNSGDQIVLTCGTVDLDRVAYGADWVYLGTAIALDPGKSNAVDNDLPASWCPATAPYGTGLYYGTPGLDNPPCPDPCDPNPCTTPPAPACLLDLVLTFSTPAACTAVDGLATCGDYPFTTTDCLATGQVCENGACVTPPPPMPTTAGQVVVTEFMAKSQAGDDPGEWIELTNVTQETFDLSGCVLRDNHSTDTHAISASLPLAPGQALALARSGDPVENHGLPFAYVYSNFFLSNTADEIVLECNAVVIDQVTYTGAQILQGVAKQLDPATLDATSNDLPENWCSAGTVYGTDGLLGTPGQANTPCAQVVDPCVPNPCTVVPPAACLDAATVVSYSGPAPCTNLAGLAWCGDYPSTVTACALGQVCVSGACVDSGVQQPALAGDVVVTEFMAKSQANTDPGEWFELYNATLTTLDLAGCVISDLGSDLHTIAASVPVAPGGHVVLAKSGDSLANHGLTPDYVYASFSLSNTADEIVVTCNGALIDQVVYAAAQAVQGVASQLSSATYDALANDTTANWCAAAAGYGTDVPQLLGTPGALNHSCGAPVDPCVPNPCTSAPAPACDVDGVTLITYTAPATCTNDAGSAVCGAYPSSPTDCSLGGQVCQGGACVTPVDPCNPSPCTTPPAATCLADGVTRVTYDATATCTNVGGAAQCGDYAATSYDCSTEGKTCAAGACVAAGPGMPTAAGQIVVTEFMARSQSNTDPYEWIELANVTDQTFDLGGCVLTDRNTTPNLHTIVGPLLVAPGGLLLLVRTASATEYGKAPDYVYGTSYSLGNSGDAIILNCGGTTIDAVDYLTAAVVLGRSQQLSSTKLDATLNDDAANWCTAPADAAHQYNATPKYGTPGAANYDCANP